MSTKICLDDYKILISTFETEGGVQYAAEFRVFEFCGGGGDTIEEAVKEARSNLEIYISELEAMGKPVPMPLKDDVDEFSGTLSLRMSKSLHKKIAGLAKTEGVSINSFIVEAVAEKAGSEPTINVLDKMSNILAQFANVVVGTPAIVGAINGYTQQMSNVWGIHNSVVPFLKVRR